MLNIQSMTQGDALHTLDVLRWIEEHRPEIEAKAEGISSRKRDVSVAEMQDRFHTVYTELTCTRFVPLRIDLLTDEDTLEAGEVTEPNVLLHNPLTNQYVVVDYLYTTILKEVSTVFSIGENEQTWQLSEHPVRSDDSDKVNAVLDHRPNL